MKKKIFKIWRQIAEIFEFFFYYYLFHRLAIFYLAFLQEKRWNTEMVFWKDCKFPSFLKQKFWSGIFTFGGKTTKKWIVWSNFSGGICSTFLVSIIMGFEPEVENVPVPGQGLRRVRNLPLVSAIGFSGKSFSFFLFFFLIEYGVQSWKNHTHKNILALIKMLSLYTTYLLMY